MTDQNPEPEDPIESELVREDATFADIVVEFVDGLEARLKKMVAAVETRDFESLRVAAHQLKGSGGGYGYPQLTEQAADLERRAKVEAIEECREALDGLKQLCDRVVVGGDDE